jgi:ABC-2 type transport system permease protein
MRGVVFKHTLRHTWLPMILWGAGLGLMGLVTILMTPLLDMAKLTEILETIPPILLKAAGMPDDVQFALSPEGMIAVGFFGKFALLFAVYPVVMGMRVTANEEDEGIMDVLLSAPIPRRRLMLEKLAAYGLTILGVVLIVLGFLWLGTTLAQETYNLNRIIESGVNLLLLLVFVLAFTAFIGATVRRKQTALAVVTIFIVTSFMVETLGALVSGSPLASIRLLSFFNYYQAADVMQRGLAWASISMLAVITAGLLAGALNAFQKRDIAA